jgi:hypothetical protein
LSPSVSAPQDAEAAPNRPTAAFSQILKEFWPDIKRKYFQRRSS